MRWFRKRADRLAQLSEAARRYSNDNRRCQWCGQRFSTIAALGVHKDTCSERPSDAAEWRH
jgi:hypothetical protein